MEIFDRIELDAWRIVSRSGDPATLIAGLSELAATMIPGAQVAAILIGFSGGGEMSSILPPGWGRATPSESDTGFSHGHDPSPGRRPSHRAAMLAGQVGKSAHKIHWLGDTSNASDPPKGRPRARADLPPSDQQMMAALATAPDHQLLGMALMRGAHGLGFAFLALPSRAEPAGDAPRLMLAIRGPLAMALALSLAGESKRRPPNAGADVESSAGDAQAESASSRREGAEAIVGADRGLSHVMERVQLVARSDVPVLILGETGSGKEVIARAIHLRSRRRKGPFMRVNCGAIPPELIDSELFGHEKGSFTGATATRQGWFERADGGTLFLDEIGELPPAAQVRLLRILQDGAFERVGGGRTMTVDIRIVAATHRDLPAMIDEGTFREDLWYRIATFPVRLPPLRERPEDLPALAAHFAQKAARRFGLHPLDPTHADLALLATYAWPGNVRELGAVMDRAAILGDGRTLEVAKALGLGSASLAAAPAPSAERRSAAPGARERPGLAYLMGAGTPEAPAESLEAVSARHIEAALAACLGRVDGPFGAAARLGLKANTLRARMKRLGLDWRRFRPAASEEG